MPVNLENIFGSMTSEEVGDLILFALNILDVETAISTIVAFADENVSLGVKDELQTRLVYDEED